MSFELELVVHSDQPSMEVELYKHMHTNSAPVATTCTLLFSAKEGEHKWPQNTHVLYVLW